MAVEMVAIVAAKREESPIPALHSPPNPPLAQPAGCPGPQRAASCPKKCPSHFPTSGWLCRCFPHCSCVPACRHSWRSTTARASTAGIAARTSLQYCNTHFCRNKWELGFTNSKVTKKMMKKTTIKKKNSKIHRRRIVIRIRI